MWVDFHLLQSNREAESWALQSNNYLNSIMVRNKTTITQQPKIISEKPKFFICFVFVFLKMRGKEILKNPPLPLPASLFRRGSCFCSFTSVLEFQSLVKITSSPRFNLWNFCSLSLSSLFFCLQPQGTCQSKPDSQGRMHLRTQGTVSRMTRVASFSSHYPLLKNVIKWGDAD